MKFGKVKHNWKPLPNPIKIMHEGNLYIYVVEYCDKTGMYQYVRVPSNIVRKRLEGEKE